MVPMLMRNANVLQRSEKLKERFVIGNYFAFG